MREKALKTLIYASGIICLYAMLATRFLPLWNLVVKEKSVPEYWDKNTWGELYYYNNIRYFREEIPPVMPKYQFTERHPDVSEAKLLTFGDSFLDFSRNKQISERLADTLNLPVFHNYSLDPLGYFADNQYANEQPKIMLYIRTERWIPLSFAGNRREIQLEASDHDDTANDEDDEAGLPRRLAKSTIDFLFNDRTDELLKTMVQRSYLLSDISSVVATLKFDLFGYVSSFTPKYTLMENRPWLFLIDQLNDQPTSFYYKHSEEEMNNIADNIKLFSDNLWEHYRIKLLFMPVPAKYTLYHNLVEPDAVYNNFLPNLYEKLDERGVSYINLYEPFKESDQYVFFGTDEHWTEAGVTIATQHALDHINELNEQVLANTTEESGISQQQLH
jgi:hypothetical protein